MAKRSKRSRQPAAPRRKPWDISPKLLNWIIAAGLVLLVSVAYVQSLGFEFTNYDDTAYVPDNTHVRDGFSLRGIGWAFTTYETANWYPLTWLSLMLDCQLFGPRPGGHHAVNAVLHTVDAVLLFIVLWRMTGRRWASAAVAALFAVHPMHVESVAWVAERKDVLSTLFFLLTLLAYHRYAARPGVGRWSLVFVCMALGLLCKSMLVTLPFVLLLLDYWPLRRMYGLRSDLLLEKVPLLALSAATAVVTVMAQASQGATAMLAAETPLPLRLANAAIASVKYLSMTFWPADLAVFYPYDFHPRPMLIAASIAILAAITLLAVALARRAPYLPVGWFWYLGTLVPTIGFVQVGAQGLADRYTYIPSIGIFLAVVWAVADLLTALGTTSVGCVERTGGETVRSARARTADDAYCPSRPDRATHQWPSVLHAPYACALFATGVLAALLVLTRQQVSYWANSERLFRHALAVAGDNPVSCESLGDTLLHHDRYAEAEEQFRKVLAMDVAKHFSQVPVELAQALEKQGGAKVQEAIALLRDALHDNPKDAQAMNELAMILGPRLLDMGEAIELLKKAIELEPKRAAPKKNLAWIYATCPERRFRNGPEAVKLARQACELSEWSNAGYRLALADAYLEVGDRQRAIEELRAAAKLSPNDGTISARLRALLLTTPGAP